MFVDVSEIKEFRHCKRKWQLSSRNSFHLTPCVPPKAFKLGTVFHECLHKLYLGKDEAEVEKYCADQLKNDDPKDATMILSMVRGYSRNVIPSDERFVPIDIEWHFKFSPFELLDGMGYYLAHEMGIADALREITIAGSIDMIALDTETNQIWGFEHKTAKNFRNDIYLWMDEQPRVYYAALKRWVDKFNERTFLQWFNAKAEFEHQHPNEEYPVPQPEPVTLGGVYINEVRKLVRAFDYKRSPLKYPEDDLRNFMLSFVTSCAECHKMVNNPSLPRNPEPDMMTCMNCQYNTICQTVQYQNVTLDGLLKEFNLEYEVRKEDHLNEKEEVNNG